MSIVKAILGGLSRSLASPGMVVGLWLVNVIVALPFAWALGTSLQDSFGDSLVHERMRDGFDMGWYGEYRPEAGEIGATFSPYVTGAGAFYENLEGWASGKLFGVARWIVGLGVVYVFIWALLWPGVLGRWTGGGFFATGGRFFARFVRLTLMSAVLYFLVYKLHGWTFDRLEDWTRDVTSERTVLLLSLAGYALTAFLLTLVHNCFGYAKIATVLEDRRSMFFAALRGTGFVLFHPGRTLGLYYAIALGSALLLALYSVLTPGAGQSTTAGVLWAFLVAQVFVGVRLVVRLTLMGAQMSLYQASSSVSRGR